MGVGTVAFNEVTCPKCGYPCQKENTACPNCGTAFIQETPQSMNTAKTVILNNSNFADYNQKEPLNNNSFLQAHDKTSNVNCNQFAATQIDYNIKPETNSTKNITTNATIAIGADTNSLKKNNFDFKKTVRDTFQQGLNTCIVAEEEKKETPQTSDHSYKLLSLDVAEEDKFEILIKSPRKIELKDGDIILIAGHRYKML